MDEQFFTEHRITNKEDDLKDFCGSKYVQSRLGDCFSQIKTLLNNDKLVCFIGTPCQVGGLKRFLINDYENLITVDVVCRSIPSLVLYKKYLSWQKSQYHSEMKKINFRNKTYGYRSGSLTIDFVNGKRYSGSNRVDLFMKSFHGNIASRPACYDCKFKTKNRCSDFTVFDCWKPEQVVIVPLRDDDKGYSNVIMHSEKAKQIINKIQNIQKYSADSEKMFQFTGGMESHSIIYPHARDEFLKGLGNVTDSSFEQYVKSYVKITIKDKLIEKSKLFLYKTGLLKVFRKIKK